MTTTHAFGGRRWRVPVQASYAAKPWWKFEHLQRFDRILMPLWQRLYPVDADTVPPPDIDALARWMQRWRLLPSRLTADAARRELEALATRPVEMIGIGGTPPGSGRIQRLPAEWEPSEAVVVTWPVLYPGLWKFYRDLVFAIAPAARVDVLIPHAIYGAAVLAYLGEDRPDYRRLHLLVTASDDIWVRDYGPLTCFDEKGQRVMVDAIFDPPPAMPYANDDAFPARYAGHLGLFCRHLAVHLEGGNLWSDGHGTLITTTGLFDRNLPAPPDDVRHRLLEGLGAQALIVLPALRMEDTGHVDVFAKLAGPETVLLTEPRSVVNRGRLAEAARVLETSRNALGNSYHVVMLPSVPAYRNWGIARIWPSYANALTVNGRVLVPTYGEPERDDAALAVYRQVMPGYDVIGIDARVAANAGGTVHCLTMQIPAGVA